MIIDKIKNINVEFPAKVPIEINDFNSENKDEIISDYAIVFNKKDLYNLADEIDGSLQNFYALYTMKQGLVEAGTIISVDFDSIQQVKENSSWNLMAKNKKLKDLAFEIAELITEYNVDQDVAIYFNDVRLQCFTTNDKEGWVLEEGFKGSEYTKYANDDTITMTFEGPLYSIMNCYIISDNFFDDFDNLLKEYGYYYELGNAWNLSLYPL